MQGLLLFNHYNHQDLPLLLFFSMGDICPIVGRVADALYHSAMTAGTAVMLMRVHAIIPIQWKKCALIAHTMVVIIRFIIGIVDVVVVTITNHDTNTCKYKNAKYVKTLKPKKRQNN